MSRKPEVSDHDEEALLELERKYCSWGDTVHYLEPPKFFGRSEGSYLYDRQGTPYLDLQMWYSAASFGYGNSRLNAALTRQLSTLPQLASQYLHPEKVELAAAISRLNASKFGLEGRVHFNVGGSQAVEDSLKIVRNTTGKNLVFAFMGGYHGRTIGASAITSSYRYRRRYGHFSDRAHFVPFPYCFRCPYDKKKEDCGLYCLKQFEKNFETEYNSFWDAKAGESEFAAFYVEPIYVHHSNVFQQSLSPDDNTFMIGLGTRLRILQTVYVVGEFTPRVSGYKPGDNQASFAIEKRAGGHMFQLNFSNSFGTTMGQIARAGANDWYLGFNLTRKFF